MANKGNLWEKFREDLVNAGCEEDEIDYARKIVRRHNPNYILDYHGSSSRTSPAQDNLENLNLNNVPDYLQRLTGEFLDTKNLQNMGPAEKEELFKQVQNDLGSIKNVLNIVTDKLENTAEDQGLSINPDKTGKTLPPPNYW